jgi:response regulator RpfG family c-di-GMP phosphodiesterase
VKSSFEVVAVENASAYGLLLEHALSSLPVSLRLFPNIVEAQNYLTSCSAWGMTPDAVLLDLKILRSSGLDMLRWIRIQPSIQAVAVVVLSGCDDAADINRAYELGIEGYVAKCAGLRDLAMTLSGVLVSQAPSRQDVVGAATR